MSTTPMACPPDRSAQLRTYRERVGSLRQELSAGTPPFDAAVLLLALRDLPPNVDRLSWRLGLRRGFVARCMRHLFDNGVLAEDGLVALWAGEEFEARAFWADVNVALGKWWRRSDGEGAVQWVPAGTWRKHYDFVSTPQTEAAPHAVYHPCEAGEEEARAEGLRLRAAEKPPLWIGADPGEEDGWRAAPVGAAAAAAPIAAAVGAREEQEEDGTPDELIGLPPETPADATPTIWLC